LGRPQDHRVISRTDDTEVKVAQRDVGWVLDRTRFDAHLAAQAVAAGARVLVGTRRRA